MQSSSGVSTSTIVHELQASARRYQACSLLQASQYRFDLAASTRKDYGPAATIAIWTEVGIPEIPPRPVIRSVGDTSVTMRIQPVVLSSGPVSGYFVVVELIDDEEVLRKKRALPDPATAMRLPGYTTAQLSRDEVKVSRDFIVGDGRTYGGFTNDLLRKNEDYNIYYVVASSLDGVTKMAFSQIASPVHTGGKLITDGVGVTSTPSVRPTNPTEEVTSAPVLREDDDSTTIIIIVAVCVAIVLLIIIIIIILLCWWRNRTNQKVPHDTKNDTWLSYYTKHFYNSPNLERGKWSDTHDLNEPRYPTINDKAVPQDIPVSDIHHNRPNISFEDEYHQLPHGLKYPHKEAQKPVNADKNRFDHVLPYDHSRVVLRDTSSDYINANYIDGFETRNAYISVQSPFNDATICDFWYMVYQEKASVIVFLSRLVEDGIVKSEEYWPDQGSLEYGILIVHHIRTDRYADFVVRVFDLELEGAGKRRITQYQFTAWPNHGVPDDPIPFLEFRMKVKRSINGHAGGPLVVHCGTGVSRTAVYIAVDSLLEQAQTENAVNVYKFCAKMRRNRTMMVRTVKQYIFIYDTLFEALITNHNIVGDDMKVSYRMLSNVNPVTDKSYFREQFEVLEKYVPKPQAEEAAVALRDQNKLKNRFNTLRLLPPDKYRPLIHTPGGLGRTDYINALFLDSYLNKNAFIVTQTPLKTTVIDFWKLVYDYKVKTLVMVNSSDFKEDSCTQYWPQHHGLQKWEPFFVKLISEEETDHVTIRNLELTSAQRPSEPARQIWQFQFESWKMYDKVPWSREGMICLVEMVERWQVAGGSSGRDAPMVVHCMDGASQSGLFCACFTLSEKLRMEGEVDIFHSIKHIKTRRFHMVNTLVSITPARRVSAILEKGDRTLGARL